MRSEAREIPGEQAILWAGDVDADDKNDRTSGGASSWDRQVVYRLVRKYSQELCQLQDQVATSSKLFLLEAFCGSDSQLTKQCNRSQAPAARFGLSQGDLESTDGRREFLRMLVAHQPEHVWMSPVCRAWCQWSEFNSQRSLEAFDRVNSQRLRSLQQVALCITVFRFQVFHKRHFHLEQPKGSLMLKLACLRELRSQTMTASFDLCRLGGPADPESGKPFRKGTTVLTTCVALGESLHGKTCPGNHEHQTIEGNVKTEQRWINRSKHSEDYTAKFAQFVVRALPRPIRASSKPIQSVHRDLAFGTDASERPQGPQPKRSRLISSSMSHRRRLENIPTTEVTDPSQDLKRRRIIGKQSPEAGANDCPWLDIVKRINVLVPRVGRIDVGDPQIIADLQHLIHDRQIIRVIACRGTDRTLAPPQDLEKGEAPYRKSLVVLRDTGELRLETMWESWEELPKHMIVRRNHSCRLNITLFARQRSVPQANQREVSTSNPNPPEPTSTPESFHGLQGPVSEDRMTAEVQRIKTRPCETSA